MTVIARAVLTFRENVEINDDMNVLASTDALTALWNRRRLIADLDALLEPGRSGQRLLVLYDLNGFKRYNDTFGHPAGDALLVRMAEQARASVGAARKRLPARRRRVLRARAGADDREIERFLDRTTEALSESAKASTSPPPSAARSSPTRLPARTTRSGSPTSASTRRSTSS